jgi:hypothetical protein
MEFFHLNVSITLKFPFFLFIYPIISIISKRFLLYKLTDLTYFKNFNFILVLLSPLAEFALEVNEYKHHCYLSQS